MQWHTFTSPQESLGRLVGMGVFGVFLIRQFFPSSMYGMFPGLDDGFIFTRWCLVTFLFLLFFHAYIVRTPALSLANRPIEIILPLICAPLPILIIVLCQLYYQQLFFHDFIATWNMTGLFTLWNLGMTNHLKAGLWIMGIGEAITVGGMWHLGSSFSIFTEARNLVSCGLYRFVRHPLYLGEIISIWGYAAFLPNTLTVLGALVFMVLQIIRAKIEEQKLLLIYPQYALYQQSIGFLIPKRR